MTARICVITAGHLATCPRMLKAADALADAGHRVRVISGRFMDWAAQADEDLRRARRGKWEWAPVDCTPVRLSAAYLWSGVRYRAARTLVRSLGPVGVPLALAARAYGRTHSELLRAALRSPADLYYGGTTGALAAVAAAGHRTGAPYALDLEDFHSGESGDPITAPFVHALAEQIERAILPGAAFLTTSSQAIARAYTDRYGVHPIPVHNTFSLPADAPDPSPMAGGGLRLYWFGQTIGPRRGIEDAIHAVGAAGIRAELHLRGVAARGFLHRLLRLGADLAPGLRIVHHEPASPDRMVELCREYDVGLAVEPGFSLNNRLALSNKAFTYLLAGLAVVFTDTPAQRTLALDLGEGALLCPPDDHGALAAGLRRWDADRDLLRRARQATWAAARRRWHWEHPEERGALLRTVAAALARRARCA